MAARVVAAAVGVADVEPQRAADRVGHERCDHAGGSSCKPEEPAKEIESSHEAAEQGQEHGHAKPGHANAIVIIKVEVVLGRIAWGNHAHRGGGDITERGIGSHRAIGREHGPIGATVEPRAEIALSLAQERLCFVGVHVGEVVDLLAASGAGAP